MTADELKAARHTLGLSAEGFARLVRVESGRTIRRWEAALPCACGALACACGLRKK